MKARRGFTLVEVVIASVILSLIVLAIFALVHSGGTSYADATRHITLQRNARVVLERIAEDLRFANPATLDAQTLTKGEGYLEYQKSISYDPTKASTPVDLRHTWSSTIRIAYALSNVDANNNGKQDEGAIIRTQDKVESTLCDYVKAYDAGTGTGGFTVTTTKVTNSAGVATTSIAISITLAVMDESQKEMTATVSTTIVLRNKT